MTTTGGITPNGDDSNVRRDIFLHLAYDIARVLRIYDINSTPSYVSSGLTLENPANRDTVFNLISSTGTHIPGYPLYKDARHEIKIVEDEDFTTMISLYPAAKKVKLYHGIEIYSYKFTPTASEIAYIHDNKLVRFSDIKAQIESDIFEKTGRNPRDPDSFEILYSPNTDAVEPWDFDKVMEDETGDYVILMKDNKHKDNDKNQMQAHTSQASDASVNVQPWDFDKWLEEQTGSSTKFLDSQILTETEPVQFSSQEPTKIDASALSSDVKAPRWLHAQTSVINDYGSVSLDWTEALNDNGYDSRDLTTEALSTNDVVSTEHIWSQYRAVNISKKINLQCNDWENLAVLTSNSCETENSKQNSPISATEHTDDVSTKNNIDLFGLDDTLETMSSVSSASDETYMDWLHTQIPSRVDDCMEFEHITAENDQSDEETNSSLIDNNSSNKNSQSSVSSAQISAKTGNIFTQVRQAIDTLLENDELNAADIGLNGAENICPNEEEEVDSNVLRLSQGASTRSYENACWYMDNITQLELHQLSMELQGIMEKRPGYVFEPLIRRVTNDPYVTKADIMKFLRTHPVILFEYEQSVKRQLARGTTQNKSTLGLLQRAWQGML